jgi:hypothetical protein
MILVYTRPYSAKIINSRYWPPVLVLFEITLLSGKRVRFGSPEPGGRIYHASVCEHLHPVEQN